ncbi:hypothetical protein R3P38DRAFT_2766812 [Favolaschia claudopus]|uniref:Uncharacterized protein n=1 Tax=Favolaschia claudopus TaxID=2862362 RepID=A0AAW0CZL2_9AGAR
MATLLSINDILREWHRMSTSGEFRDSQVPTAFIAYRKWQDNLTRIVWSTFRLRENTHETNLTIEFRGTGNRGFIRGTVEQRLRIVDPWQAFPIQVQGTPMRLVFGHIQGSETAVVHFRDDITMCFQDRSVFKWEWIDLGWTVKHVAGNRVVARYYAVSLQPELGSKWRTVVLVVSEGVSVNLCSRNENIEHQSPVDEI